MDEQIPMAMTHHESLYFPDGDLAIASALQQGSRTVIRVHKFMVSRHSPVFRDMLSFPLGEGGAEGDLYDGVPLVLLPDELDEIVALFDIFYNPGYPLFEHNDANFPLIGYKLMKMGRKYQIDSICKAVKHHLELQWPNTLSGLRELLQHARERMGENMDPLESPVWKMLPEPAATIRLAVDFDVSSVLPAAFYVLSTLDDDYTWPGGRWSRPARWSLLTKSERGAYFEGKNKLGRIQLDLSGVFSQLEPSNLYDCEGSYEMDETQSRSLDEAGLVISDLGGPCMMNADELMTDWFRKNQLGSGAVRSPDPISVLLRLKNELSTMKFCKVCRPDAEQHIENKIKSVWKRAPGFFGLW